MVTIPIKKSPNQSLLTVLDSQNCKIHIYQRGEYMYFDLTVNGKTIRTGMMILAGVSLIDFNTPHFSGILFFFDKTGKNGVPYYTELGSRYQLLYFTKEEIDALKNGS